MAGVVILYMALKAFRHFRPFGGKVFTIGVAGIAILQASFAVPGVAVIDRGFFTAAQRHEKYARHERNYVVVFVHR
ncbi:MAG: hypothetical protein HW390_3071 [Candidatus Brocadiaceae bacterium]|nr:hypothetical protein [Candidatus Brocadiaceae bacterium]